MRQAVPVNATPDQVTEATRLADQSTAIRSSLISYFRRRVRDPAEVDDLVQDVFLRIVQRGGTSGLDHFEGYVFQTAASVLADRHRRRTVRHADDHIQFDADEHAELDFDAERLIEGKTALRAATTALMALPERTRIIFLLKRLEGFRHREIAHRLGISVSAVEKHMLKAVQHLAAYRGESA